MLQIQIILPGHNCSESCKCDLPAGQPPAAPDRATPGESRKATSGTRMYAIGRLAQQQRSLASPHRVPPTMAMMLTSAGETTKKRTALRWGSRSQQQTQAALAARYSLMHQASCESLRYCLPNSILLSACTTSASRSAVSSTPHAYLMSPSLMPYASRSAGGTFQ